MEQLALSRVKRVLRIIDRVSRAGNENIAFPDEQLVRKGMPGSSFRWLVGERKKIILKPMLLFPVRPCSKSDECLEGPNSKRR